MKYCIKCKKQYPVYVEECPRCDVELIDATYEDMMNGNFNEDSKNQDGNVNQKVTAMPNANIFSNRNMSADASSISGMNIAPNTGLFQNRNREQETITTANRDGMRGRNMQSSANAYSSRMSNLSETLDKDRAAGTRALSERDRAARERVARERAISSREQMPETMAGRDRMSDARAMAGRDKMSDARAMAGRDKMSDARAMAGRDKMSDARAMAGRDKMSDARAMAGRDKMSDARAMAGRDRMSDARVMAGRDKMSDARVMAGRDRMSDARAMAERDRMSDAKAMAGRDRRSRASSMSERDSVAGTSVLPTTIKNSKSDTVLLPKSEIIESINDTNLNRGTINQIDTGYNGSQVDFSEYYNFTNADGYGNNDVFMSIGNDESVVITANSDGSNLPVLYNGKQNMEISNQADFSISVSAEAIDNVVYDSGNFYNNINNEGNGEQHMYQNNDMNGNSMNAGMMNGQVNTGVMNNQMNTGLMNNQMNTSVANGQVNTGVMNNQINTGVANGQANTSVVNNSMNNNVVSNVPSDYNTLNKENTTGKFMKFVAAIIAMIAIAGSAIVAWTQTKVAKYDEYGSQVIGYSPDWKQFIFYFVAYLAACVLLCGFLYGMGEIVCLLQKIINKMKGN